ncbi:MAG: hypothetical protein GVY04_11965 [Cyanobacteria bacterium]|nr:hypothetical protein [Cyanobacteria bacterium GSL.Bin1]
MDSIESVIQTDQDMLNFIDSDLVMGLISGLAINFIPFVNRRLDKATSSYAGKIAFFIVETVEAFEDGKITLGRG